MEPRELAMLVVLVGLIPMGGCLGDDDPGDPAGATPPPDGDQAAWSWTALSDAPTPRTEVAAVILDGQLVVLGGFEANNAVSNKVEAMDLESREWRTLAPLPVPLHHAPAVVHDGQIHVLGGHAGIPFIPQSIHLVYDPAMDNWTLGTSLPGPRGAHGAAVIDGKAYLAGGVNMQGLEARVDVYDLGDDAWTTAPDLPTPREHLAVASLDGRLHVLGGREGGLDTNLDTHEALTPGEDWETLAPLPTARGGIGGAAVAGLVAVAGGEEGGGTFEEVEAYDPTTGTWTALPGMPTPRHGLGVVGHDGRLFTAAGGPEPGLTVSGAVEVLAQAAPR